MGNTDRDRTSLEHGSSQTGSGQEEWMNAETLKPELQALGRLLRGAVLNSARGVQELNDQPRRISNTSSFDILNYWATRLASDDYSGVQVIVKRYNTRYEVVVRPDLNTTFLDADVTESGHRAVHGLSVSLSDPEIRVQETEVRGGATTRYVSSSSVSPKTFVHERPESGGMPVERPHLNYLVSVGGLTQLPPSSNALAQLAVNHSDSYVLSSVFNGNRPRRLNNPWERPNNLQINVFASFANAVTRITDKVGQMGKITVVSTRR